MMHVYFYISKDTNPGRALLHFVEEKVEHGRLMSFISLPAMDTHLKLSVKRGDIIIFQPNTDTELEHLIEMQDFLEDLRLILILPDSSPETVAKGHLLRPSFLTYADHDMSKVRLVLEKMMQKVVG